MSFGSGYEVAEIERPVAAKWLVQNSGRLLRHRFVDEGFVVLVELRRWPHEQASLIRSHLQRLSRLRHVRPGRRADPRVGTAAGGGAWPRRRYFGVASLQHGSAWSDFVRQVLAGCTRVIDEEGGCLKRGDGLWLTCLRRRDIFDAILIGRRARRRASAMDLQARQAHRSHIAVIANGPSLDWPYHLTEVSELLGSFNAANVALTVAQPDSCCGMEVGVATFGVRQLSLRCFDWRAGWASGDGIEVRGMRSSLTFTGLSRRGTRLLLSLGPVRCLAVPSRNRAALKRLGGDAWLPARSRVLWEEL